LAAVGDGQMIAGMTSASVMTIGRLSRRTGVPVKVLREYEDMGLITATPACRYPAQAPR